MDHRPPAPASDAGAAEWIAPRLLDDFGAVCTTIPTGFEAYARILHPADPGAGTSTRWAEVAEATGRTMHALAQFARIAAPHPAITHGDVSVEVQAPMTGDLAPSELRALSEILQTHTPAALRCWFAVWEGWGELTGAVSLIRATTADPAASPRPAPSEWQLDLRAAQFVLPGRVYYLFTGPLHEALRFGYWATADWFLPRSPNLFWPDDRRWCVASEIDFDSTLVAGTAALIGDIIHSDELEAYPVDPRDSLAFDGDTINQP